MKSRYIFLEPTHQPDEIAISKPASMSNHLWDIFSKDKYTSFIQHGKILSWGLPVLTVSVLACVSDPVGSEVQQFSGLVVIWSAAVRDADRSVTVPRPRWRGAVSVHTNRQPSLSPLAHQRCQGHSGQGQTLCVCWRVSMVVSGGLLGC